MKKIRTYLIRGSFLLFILGLFLLDKALEFLYTTNPNIKSNFVRISPPNADVIVLGSSNVMSGFEPVAYRQETGKKAYNLSAYHATFAEQKSMLYLYLKYNSKPECVLIGFNPADINFYRSEFHAAPYIFYRNDTTIAWYLEENDEWSFRVSYLPLIRYTWHNPNVLPYAGQSLYKMLSGHAGAFSPGGYYEAHQNKGFMARFEKAVNQRSTALSPELNNKDLSELLDLLDFVKVQGIRCLVFITPVYQQARKCIYNEGHINEELKNSIRERGMQFYAFSDSLSAKEENFAGVFHMTKTGARKLTHELARQVENP